MSEQYEIVDITPTDSVAPVFLDPTPLESIPEGPTLEEIQAQQIALRTSAVEKLLVLGLTEEEISALR